MTFDQFLRILRARWKLAISVFVLIVAGAVIGSLIFPKQYSSSTTVILDSRPDAISAVTPMSMGSAMTYLTTQIDVIESPTVSRRVVRSMNITANPALQEEWRQETKGQGNFEAWVAKLMSKNLSVKPSRDSNVIEIIYEGSDPAFAAAMANAYARAYIDTTLQFRVNPAREYADFFEGRAKLAREKLDQAQQKLAAAQNEKGIIATDERLDVETMRLSELSQQVLALRASTSDVQNRYAQSRKNPAGSPEVISNQFISSLKSDLSRRETRLNELLERFGNAHPTVIEERANIADLKRQIERETSLVSRSLNVTSAASLGRENEILAAYEAQKVKILQLKSARSELAVLEREVDSAQRLYDAIMSRVSQTDLEGSTRQAGVMVLSPAVESTKPSSPKMLLNVGLALVLGALLAMLAAMGMELIDRRVRSPEDLAQLLGVAVLGALPRPDSKSSSGVLARLSNKNRNRPALT